MSDMIDLEDYRRSARLWLEENLSGATPRRHRPSVGSTTRPSKALLLNGSSSASSSTPDTPASPGQPSTEARGSVAAHDAAFVQEARAFRIPDFGVAGGTTVNVCAPTMLAHAAPEFLKYHIPRILAGEELFVQFFSEPGAGSDLAGITTRATRDGEEWILNGSKIWSSGAYYADYGMCLARTDWDVPKHRGLTWFAVRIDQPGVTVQPVREINGDAEFCQEFFDDVRLQRRRRHRRRQPGLERCPDNAGVRAGRLTRLDASSDAYQGGIRSGLGRACPPDRTRP